MKENNLSDRDSGSFQTGAVRIREHVAVKLVIMLDARNIEVSVKWNGGLRTFWTPV
jgi:hypothetical protein